MTIISLIFTLYPHIDPCLSHYLAPFAVTKASNLHSNLQIELGKKMFLRLHVLLAAREKNVVLTEFPWMHSAAIG